MGHSDKLGREYLCSDEYTGGKEQFFHADVMIDGQQHKLRRTFYLPLNWELEVTGFATNVNVYLDEHYTVPYIYPGDGVSCDIYVTTAVG